MSGARSHMSVFDVSSPAATRGLDVGLRLRAWPLELVNDAPLDADLIADEVAALTGARRTGPVCRLRSTALPKDLVARVRLDGGRR